MDLTDVTELDQTASDIAREFAASTFMVKESDGVFNQAHTQCTGS